MSKQSIFDKACNSYSQATNMLDEIGNIINNLDDEFEYDINVTKKYFDILLQTILLDVACSDNMISSIEASFMDKITDYIDILSYLDLSYSNGDSITWNNLTRLNSSQYSLLCNDIYDFANPKICDLLNIIAMADTLTNKEFSKRFIDIIVVIICCFCDIDDDFSDINYAKEVLMEKIGKYLVDAKLSINNKIANASTNSLQKYYNLKKNK